MKTSQKHWKEQKKNKTIPTNDLGMQLELIMCRHVEFSFYTFFLGEIHIFHPSILCAFSFLYFPRIRAMTCFLCFFCHFLLFLAIIGLSVCTHFYSVCYYKVFFSWPQRSIMKLSAGYTSFYFFFHAFCVASVPESFDGLNPIRISGVFVFVCVCSWCAQLRYTVPHLKWSELIGMGW